MVVLFFFVVSIGFLVYGGLVITGRFVPPTSKLLIEDEERDSWCKTEGFAKILWGVDLSFLTLYFQKLFFPQLWLAAFLVLTVYIILIAYKNNQKHMK